MNEQFSVDETALENPKPKTKTPFERRKFKTDEYEWGTPRVVAPRAPEPKGPSPLVSSEQAQRIAADIEMERMEKGKKITLTEPISKFIKSKAFDSLPEIDTLYFVEQKYILMVLQICGGNRVWTAKKLGISIRGLRNKINDYKSKELNGFGLW